MAETVDQQCFCKVSSPGERTTDLTRLGPDVAVGRLPGFLAGLGEE